jgi:hypothetical protein
MLPCSATAVNARNWEIVNAMKNRRDR